MILQSLKKYYDRLAESDEDEVPLLGFARQKIHFCLVLEPDGNPVNVQVMDLRVLDGKKPRPMEADRPGTGDTLLRDRCELPMGQHGLRAGGGRERQARPRPADARGIQETGTPDRRPG